MKFSNLRFVILKKVMLLLMQNNNELNSGLPRTNPGSSRMEDLNQGPPDFKSSALNHSATLSPNHAGSYTDTSWLFIAGFTVNVGRDWIVSISVWMVVRCMFSGE